MFGRSRDCKPGLTKTRQSFFGRIAGLFREREITERDLGRPGDAAHPGRCRRQDDGATGGMRCARMWSATGARTPAQVEALLKEQCWLSSGKAERPYLQGERLLNVVLVVGVNGSGKTTSIAKLAKYHKDRGQTVRAGRGRHLPRGGHRPAQSLGRARGRGGDRAPARRRSRGGGLRCHPRQPGT